MKGNTMEKHEQHATSGAYSRLGIEVIIDFAVMYLIMFTMIAALDHFYLNLNNVYMTLMMVSPMTVAMQLFMRSMYPSARINAIITVGAILVFVGSFAAMRTQAGVGDTQFLRSMIPHHSGAILMCEQASIKDPEIAGLCRGIVDAQKKEIEQMKAILNRH